VINRTRSTVMALVVVCALFGAAAASASASTAWVSNTSPVVTGGKSCAQPGFKKVQDAINSGAGAVDVCPGIYTEQLTITSSVKLIAINGANTATLAMPAAAANSTTSCDTMVGPEQKDEISICTPGTVTITNLAVEAIVPTTGCGGQLYGIFVGDGGTVKATNVAINGASTNVNGLKGCQYGVAVEIGNKTPAEVGHGVLNKVTVTGYQKNGPTVKSPGSTLSITASTITGAGESPYIAQNGVEVAFGAKGNVNSSVISGNECSLPGACSATNLENHASGAVFYQAAAGSAVANSTLKENDDGAYYASGSATVPAVADVTFNKDILTNNRYEGFQIEEGKTLLKADTVNGSSLVGINLVQTSLQESASQSSASATKISGQTEAAIKVTSDKAAGDIPGKFTFSNGTASAPVLINESNNFEVIF
jgi:hypothetical protein